MQTYLKPFKSPNPDLEHVWTVVPVIITAQTDKFENYQPISGQDITTADSRTLRAIGVSDVCIELPNGTKQTNMKLSMPQTWPLP